MKQTKGESNGMWVDKRLHGGSSVWDLGFLEFRVTVSTNLVNWVKGTFNWVTSQ